MRTSKTQPVEGSFLFRLGLFAVVVAIIGGLLGMHVVGGIHTASMVPAPMASPSAPAPPTVHAAVSNHASSPHASPVAGHATLEHPGGTPTCGGSPADGHSSVAGHGSCVPSFGPGLPGVPLPGMLAWPHAETAFTSAPGPKSMGRVPDPPSLIQLSINRT
ncbi:hypothetical protein RF641_11135 [Arthrobacter sp. LS16]|uniref:hypothetical protein n=1 Tax=Arthrobacter sp. 'calajunan' TaxID=1690248 RepID=UPI003C72D4A7